MPARFELPVRLRVLSLGAVLLWTLRVILPVEGKPPEGWFLAGSHPENFETGLESRGEGEGSMTFLRSKGSEATGFGSLAQAFSPEKYKGKRVRLSAEIRSEGVKKRAAMWMRVDGQESWRSLAFDAMADRPISGDTPWKRYEIVLDVAQEATVVVIGFMLVEDGQLWMDRVRVEIVDESVPTTNRKRHPGPDEPANLDFES